MAETIGLSKHQDVVSYIYSDCGKSTHSIPAVVDARSKIQITHGDIRRKAAAVAAGMYGLGLRAKDVVMVVMPNCIEFVLAVCGALSTGIVVTAANPLSTAAEIEKQVTDSRARCLICNVEVADKVKALQLRLVLVGATVGNLDGLDYIQFSRLLSCRSDLAPTVPIQQQDVAVLLYSSGTTGVSKGVVLTHRNLIAALESIRQAADQHPAEVCLSLLPMFHVAGLIWGIFDTLRQRALLIILPRFNLHDAFNAIQQYRVTFLLCVPPIVVAFTKSADARKYDLRSLKSVVCGAAPLGKDTTESFLTLFPHVTSFQQAWGMTETTGVGFGFAYGGPLGSAGRPMPFVEAKVVDVHNGHSLSSNEEGELCLRGPFVMKEYLNNPTATAATIDAEGWLHTGDLVYIDPERNMYVVDRLKELIKYKGFQVAPAELEAVLLRHEKIADCAVVPFPDDEAGEIPLAYVVVAAGISVTGSEIIDYVASHVAPHKKIRSVRFVDSIPKSPSGKILRKHLTQSARSRI